jgi:butyrate kinase
LKSIDSLDAIAARGGPLKPLDGGVYAINKPMLDAFNAGTYSNHASNLGALLAARLTDHWSVKAFVVDPVTTDELIKKARISGVPEIERRGRSHALNIKFCVRAASESLKLGNNPTRFIVAHLGSGFSIAAVRDGKIIDVNDALLGMGPFSVERAGSLPLAGIIEILHKKGNTKSDVIHKLSRESGLKGYLGTRSFPQIEERIQANDETAKSVFDAMIYQIVKEIGGYYAGFHGDVTGLILTGGLCQSSLVTDRLCQELKFIQPQLIFPGSFELEAMVAGVLRVLNKTEPVQEYK